MTTHTTNAAHEAAANAAITEIARQMNADLANNGFDDYVDIVTEDDVFAICISKVRRVIIDAFLSKSLEGADGRVAEIQEIDRGEKHLAHDYLDHPRLRAHRTELLTLVTALSAKLKKATDEILSEQWKRGELLQEVDALKSKLTAQKAAHAKMLRDEADVSDKSGRDRMASRVLRYLADKIEGGE